jgi:hypothetical protein
VAAKVAHQGRPSGEDKRRWLGRRACGMAEEVLGLCYRAGGEGGSRTEGMNRRRRQLLHQCFGFAEPKGNWKRKTARG